MNHDQAGGSDSVIANAQDEAGVGERLRSEAARDSSSRNGPRGVAPRVLATKLLPPRPDGPRTGLPPKAPPGRQPFFGGVNLIFRINSTTWPFSTFPDTAVIALTTLTYLRA